MTRSTAAGALNEVPAPETTANLGIGEDRQSGGSGDTIVATVTPLPLRRSLPLMTELVPGESVDSWVEAIASRYETSTCVIFDAVGVRLPSSMPAVLLRLQATVLRRAAGLAGVPTSELAAAAGVGAPPAAWLPGTRSRYCPACLAGTGGRWQLAWRATVSAICPTHQLLLADRCPSCGAFLRVRLTSAPSPLHCTARLPDQSRCGADLTLAVRTPAPTDRAGEHAWAATLLASAADSETAGAHLADATAVLTWVERMHQASHPGSGITLGRYRTAAATALLLPHVATILGADTTAAIARIRDLTAAAGGPVTVAPRGLAGPTFTNMAGPFPNRYRRAVDPRLNVIDRLRYRSTTPGARPPAGVPAARVRGIPELLWPDWYARLRPVADLRGDRARATYSNALLVPGLIDRQLKPSLATLNRHRGCCALSTVLRAYPAETQTAVLQVLTRLADHLDVSPGPIDYQRRRDAVAGLPLLYWEQWRSMAVGADTHPGDGPGVTRTRRPRLVHARRYLQVLLCGADLTNPRHELAWDSCADRGRYHAFAGAVTPRLRAALHGHAQGLLTQHGIDEPLTWSPPRGLADGLELPGIDPAALDPAAVTDVTLHGHNVSDVAARLGVHVDHVRLAIEALDLPAASLSSKATARLHSGDRARAVATHAFFEQHYLREGLLLRELTQLTGIPRGTLAGLARVHGIPLRSGVDPVNPDPAWLREQYLTLGHSTADLAVDLGVSAETVSRALTRVGIPLRASGVYGRREMHAPLDPAHPPVVRAAVEGTLHGWLRLARFQTAIAYPTMKAAAAAMGIHLTALTVEIQRLETDTAGRLYERAAYGKPQRPTRHGQALLEALDQPPTAAALRAATGPAPPSPDPATLDTLRAELSTRSPARPAAGYPGLAVQPQRRSAATLAVVAYLADHADRDVWGYLVAKELHLHHGTVYPILTRLHDGGWTTSHTETLDEWEARAPHRRGDSRLRRHYRLTTHGMRAAALIAMS